MEDDIDIEEHDVLDNPRIRTIFPDIARIKAEIPDDNYNDPDQEMEYQPYSPDDHPHEGDEDTSEHTRFGNKIILGSKPTSSILESVLTLGRKPVEIKQEVKEHEATADEDIPEEHYSQPSTVLILGSKPSSSGVITPFTVNNPSYKDSGHVNATTTFLGHEVDLDEMDLSENEINQDTDAREPRDPSAAVVLVENWGLRLENSACYCKECQILFPTSNTLLAHNMTAHSFLVALDKNKAVKSTSKPTAKKVETGKFCNHCNTMFPDSDTLINHLYMKLTFDKNNAVLKNQPKKVVTNPFNKQVNANLVKSQRSDLSKSSKLPTNVQVYAQGATDLFRCEVCSYYCEMYWVFVRHMKDNHSKSTFNQEKEIFDGTCPHCNSVLKSKLVYNRHIQSTHSDIFNFNACSANELLYRCDICSYYVEMKWALVRHMKQNHKKYSSESVDIEQRAFDGKCPHCSSVFNSRKNYNRHVTNVHENFFNLKGDLPSNKGQNIKTPTPKKIPVIRESNDIKSKPNPAKNIKTPTPKKIPVIRESNDIKSKPNPAKINFNSQKFQCQKCSEMFANYVSARRHRRLKHPELKTLSLFKRIVNFGKTVSVQKARIPSKITLKHPKNLSTGKNDAVMKQPDASPSTSKSPLKYNNPDIISKPPNQIVIPKLIIFKCNKCDVHFTSCTATVLHAKCCGKEIDDWKCNICNRLFQSFDQTVHKRQHQVSEKFNVIVFHENIYGRVLNQCPNCKLYFHEKEFYLHDQKKYCRGAGVKCEKCATLIHITSVETHSKWHERSKNNKKNMILVEFAGINIGKALPTPAKRVLNMGENEEPPILAKKAKIEKSQTLKTQIVKYCQKCSVFMFSSSQAKLHISGKCKSIRDIKKKICKICGLTYTNNSHMGYHKTYPDLTLMGMRFLSVNDNVVIKPPIPNFPGCRKCKVHFCKKDTVRTHNCKESYKTCKYCKERYSDLAYKLHMKFHEYHAKFEAEKSVEGSSSGKPSLPQKSVTNPMPELLKKYEMLTNTWNILFLCSSCDIVCDNYDKVVDHCQRHFNNLESYDVMIQYCKICELKFDDSCFERHKALHARNESVTKNSFVVCSYRYKNLLKFGWLYDFYRVIPETQMQQILSKSIYSYTGRSIKLRVVKEGPPENTIYRCGKCELFVHPQTIANHFKFLSCNKDSAVKYNCRYCDLPFSSFPAKCHHERSHRTAKSFNVVYFNENGDEEFNQKLVENNSIKQALGPAMKKGMYYYRCEKCKCCMLNKRKALIHNCPKPGLIKQCNLCNLHFYVKTFSRHIKAHELNPRLSPEDIKYCVFERGLKGIIFKEDKKEKTVVRLYKCNCGLHFTSTKAIDRHFEVCCVNDDVNKERCSKCERLFDTNQLVAHLCKHHSKDNDIDTEFEIINISPGNRVRSQVTLPKVEKTSTIDRFDKRKDLFKCQKCDVYYLSQGGLAYHFERNHQVYKVTKCPYCKLKFMPLTLQKHITIQHKLLRCKVADFIIYYGVNDKGTLRIHKSPLVTKRAPRKKIITKDGSIAIKDAHRNVDMAIYNKSLYKCKICGMHLLTLQALRTHNDRYKGQHTSVLIDCPDCGYAFSRVSLPKHYCVHHERMNLKRKELKIKYLRKYRTTNDSTDSETDDKENDHSSDDTEQFSEKENVVSLVKKSFSLQQSKNNPDNDTSRAKDKRTKTYKNTSVLYECTICNIIYFKNSIVDHVKSHSTNKIMPSQHTCSCGLSFSVITIAKHENLHHGIQNLTRDELYVIKMSLHDGIVGSNHLFKCEICQVHLCTMHGLENHLNAVEHNAQTKTCLQCGLLFTMTGIVAHIKLHHDAMKLRREDFVVLHSVGDSEVQVVCQNRRLYKCRVCSTHYLSSDDCKHENAPTAVCKNCHLKFSEDALEAHVETHHTRVDLKKDDFEIIEISNIDNETLDDTQTVPNIGSILYKCLGCCMHFLHKSTLETHLIRGVSLRKPFKETCEHCGLYFSSKTLKKHMKQHIMQKLTLKDFRVIDQGEAGLSDLTCLVSNMKNEDVIESAETPIENTKDKEPLDSDKNDLLERKVTYMVKNKLYQCDKCECCFLTVTNARDHYGACQYVQTYVECDQCQLKFHKSLSMHKKLHHETQNLKRKDLVIIRYSPKKKLLTNFLESMSPTKLIESETVSTLDKKLYTNQLFKCGTCSLHFLIKETLEIHTKNPELKLPKLTCTFCDLAFSVHTLPAHVYIHHENMKLTTADFCITVKDEIMKDACAQEDSSIFLESVTRETTGEILASNKQSLSESEIAEAKNDAGKSDQIIELRDLTLSPDTALEVESSTISEPKIYESCEDSLEDKTVLVSSKTGATEETEISKTVKLYKCAACNVCFLTQVSCYRHTVNHVALNPKDYIECKLCGYQFLILNNCLHKHVTKHHEKLFKPEEVLIEEYHPDILCHGTPKINIYFGTDKLQSKLISTTSDANVSSECLENSEVEITNPDNNSPELNMYKKSDIVPANSDEKGVKPTDNTILNNMDIDSDMEIDSDIVNVISASGDDNIINMNDTAYKNLDTVSLDSTDKNDDDSNKSITDLDLEKSSDMNSVESADGGIKLKTY